jgi:predicted GNAT superfamily acetyltransferase
VAVRQPNAEAVAAAWSAVGSATAAAGIEVRELHTLADLHEVLALYRGIWGESPVNLEQLRAQTHAGNYTAGAYRDGTLTGGCVGFFAAPPGGPPGASLHSHVAGVVTSARAGNVGFALKLHQRAWAMARGLTEITWTFDPLVRRNAHFNLVKLAARPREYLIDFYGDLPDAVNAGQGSDRLLVAWDLLAPAVVSACGGQPAPADPAGAAPALALAPDGTPRPARVTAGAVLVPVPDDVEQLRRQQPDLARRWRQAVRNVLGGLMAGGARVVGFATPEGYLVEQWSPRKLAREERTRP